MEVDPQNALALSDDEIVTPETSDDETTQLLLRQGPGVRVLARQLTGERLSSDRESVNSKLLESTDGGVRVSLTKMQ